MSSHSAHHATTPGAVAPVPTWSALFPFPAWTRRPVLRTPLVGAFVALVATPPTALVLAQDDPRAATVVFASYFALAWFLLMRALVRPQLQPAMYAQIVAVALVTQIPLALALENLFDVDRGNLFANIVGTAAPEELVKVLPVVGLALLQRRTWFRLAPRDFLFLGLVSGMAFGVAEAVGYVGSSTNEGLVAVWRLVANPLAHGCWAGISAYFVGLAVARRRHGGTAPLVGLGLGIPVLLHGLNNWTPVTGTLLWVVLAVLSALLFLGYALVGVAPAVSAPPAVATPPVPPPPVAMLSPVGTSPVTCAPTTSEPLTEPISLPEVTAISGGFRGPDGRWWA